MDSASPEVEQKSNDEFEQVTTTSEAITLTTTRVETLAKLVESSGENFVTDETRILVWKICRSYNDWPAWRLAISTTLVKANYDDLAIWLTKRLLDLGPAKNEAFWKFSMHLFTSLARYSTIKVFRVNVYKSPKDILKSIFEYLESTQMFVEHLSTKDQPEEYSSEKWAIVKVLLRLVLQLFKENKMKPEFSFNNTLKVISAFAKSDEPRVRFIATCCLPFVASSGELKTIEKELEVGKQLLDGNEEALKDCSNETYFGLHFREIATSVVLFGFKTDEIGNISETISLDTLVGKPGFACFPLIFHTDPAINKLGSVVFRSFCEQINDRTGLLLSFNRTVISLEKNGKTDEIAKAADFGTEYAKWWRARNANATDDIFLTVVPNDLIFVEDGVVAETKIRTKFLQTFAELSPAVLISNATKKVLDLIDLSYQRRPDWAPKITQTAVQADLQSVSVKYLKFCFEKGVTQSDYYEAAISILMIYLNFTDSSEQFRLALAKAGGVKLLVGYLENNTKLKEKSNNETVIVKIITVVYNLSRSIELKSELLECNTVEILKNFMGVSEFLNACISLSFAHILSDTADATNLAVEQNVVPTIVGYVKKAMKDPRRRCTIGSSYMHLEELIEGLALLASNDSIKDILLQNGICEIIDFLLKSNESKLEALGVDLVWTMSFQKAARERLASGDEKVIDSVKALSISKTTTADVMKSATKTLAFIDNWQKKVAAAEATSDESGRRSTSPGEEGHIFLSYSWKQQPTVLQMKESLVKHGYKVWMDVDKMHGDLLEAMAEAVEKASVVLICFSSSYKQSNPCRSEAQYAHALSKPIVPVNMEYHYFPDGWLGILVRSRKFIDMSLEKRPFEVAFQMLLAELDVSKAASKADPQEAIGGGHSTTIHSTTITPRVALPKKDLRFLSWSKQDVQEWLVREDLHRDFGTMFAAFDGKMLKTLFVMNSKAPDCYYNKLGKHYTGSLFDEVKLLGALDRLWESDC